MRWAIERWQSLGDRLLVHEVVPSSVTPDETGCVTGPAVEPWLFSNARARGRPPRQQRRLGPSQRAVPTFGLAMYGDALYRFVW